LTLSRAPDPRLLQEVGDLAAHQVVDFMNFEGFLESGFLIETRILTQRVKVYTILSIRLGIYLLYTKVVDGLIILIYYWRVMEGFYRYLVGARYMVPLRWHHISCFYGVVYLQGKLV
jgi:hypothetical protein